MSYAITAAVPLLGLLLSSLLMYLARNRSLPIFFIAGLIPVVLAITLMFMLS